MSELIRREDALQAIKYSEFGKEYDEVEKVPAVAATRWRRVEEPPLPNQDLWLHDEHGYYHVGYISTHRGYTEYIDMDGNALHGIDYWMPIEPPKEITNE